MLYSPDALKKVIAFLSEHHIPYMVIGGLAVSTWGETRVTNDADFKVNIDMPLADFRKLVLDHFPGRPTNIPQHMLSPQVIHVWALPNMAVDFLVSIFEYEKQAIERAVKVDILGIQIRVCTAEDLIIHKAIAERVKDWDDIEGVLMRQRGKLDLAYIRNWLSQFAEALEKPEILTRFNQLYETT
jgi:predicted nucleotidyltransferase